MTHIMTLAAQVVQATATPQAQGPWGSMVSDPNFKWLVFGVIFLLVVGLLLMRLGKSRGE